MASRSGARVSPTATPIVVAPRQASARAPMTIVSWRGGAAGAGAWAASCDGSTVIPNTMPAMPSEGSCWACHGGAMRRCASAGDGRAPRATLG